MYKNIWIFLQKSTGTVIDVQYILGLPHHNIQQLVGIVREIITENTLRSETEYIFLNFGKKKMLVRIYIW